MKVVICTIILVIYNIEPNSKDNSEYAVLCSLLRGSTFFFLALHGKALGYKNFEFKRSQL